MNNLKRKIKNAVDLYKQTFQSEYNQVIIEIDKARKNQKTDFGEVITDDGKEHSIKRELYRMPEKLYAIITSNLTADEISNIDTKEFAFWFIKEFPQFKMTKHE